MMISAFPYIGFDVSTCFLNVRSIVSGYTVKKFNRGRPRFFFRATTPGGKICKTHTGLQGVSGMDGVLFTPDHQHTNVLLALTSRK